MNGFGAHLNSTIDEWRSRYRRGIRPTFIKNQLRSKMFDDRLINLFYYVHQKKIYYSIVLHLDELLLLFGEQKQRDAFQFNRHSTIRFVFLSSVLSLLIFILSFKLLLHFYWC